MGKDNRGMASKNQQMDTLHVRRDLGGSTVQHIHVTDVSNGSLVEFPRLDILSTSNERHQDGQETSTSETNDRHTQECVESSRGAEIDASKGALDDCVEVECVEREFKL